MADPFRLRVLKAVTAQIKTITPANGYVYDLSDYTDSAGRTASRAFRGRSEFGDSDPLPMVSILEDPKPQGENNAGFAQVNTTGVYRLLLQGFVDDDHTNPTDPAHVLVADVMSALVKAKMLKYDILGLGPKLPCVVDLKIEQPVVRPPDHETSSVAFFLLGVTLTLVEDLEKPYA